MFFDFSCFRHSPDHCRFACIGRRFASFFCRFSYFGHPCCFGRLFGIVNTISPPSHQNLQS